MLRENLTTEIVGHSTLSSFSFFKGTTSHFSTGLDAEVGGMTNFLAVFT
jgi:hypothetical protein